MSRQRFGSASLAQLGLCSEDIGSTLRLYTEAYGFADAGAHVMWGRYLAGLQGLGDDATCLLWWMVGRQARVQLELFQHVDPVQQPLPADWRPSDIGWVRWAIALPDLADALARLARFGIAPTANGPVEQLGVQRAVVIDPGTKVPIELLQESDALPGGIRPRENSLMPAVHHATVSVLDLDRALDFYCGVLGMEDAEVQLHGPESEALWGLEGATCRTRVLRAGDAFVEVVQYLDPAPRPRSPSRRLSDQGFMNAGFLAEDRAHFDEILRRAADRGIVPNLEPPDRPNGEAYLVDGDGTLTELMLVPREFEPEYGFVARPRFPPPSPWPPPRVGAAR